MNKNWKVANSKHQKFPVTNGQYQYAKVSVNFVTAITNVQIYPNPTK
ncbi:MAG: hypothetical protein ACTTJH_06305 [Bacteroidales bacterium]